MQQRVWGFPDSGSQSASIAAMFTQTGTDKVSFGTRRARCKQLFPAPKLRRRERLAAGLRYSIMKPFQSGPWCSGICEGVYRLYQERDRVWGVDYEKQSSLLFFTLSRNHNWRKRPTWGLGSWIFLIKLWKVYSDNAWQKKPWTEYIFHLVVFQLLF